jgi:hypothetical protein
VGSATRSKIRLAVGGVDPPGEMFFVCFGIGFQCRYGRTTEVMTKPPPGSATSKSGNLWAEDQHPPVLIDPSVPPP